MTDSDTGSSTVDYEVTNGAYEDMMSDGEATTGAPDAAMAKHPPTAKHGGDDGRRRRRCDGRCRSDLRRQRARDNDGRNRNYRGRQHRR